MAENDFEDIDEQEDSRPFLVRVIEDHPMIFMSNDEPLEKQIRVDDYGEEYTEPLVEGYRCRYFFSTGYLIRLLIAFAILAPVLVLNLVTIGNQITATKIIAIVLLILLVISVGGRLFGLSIAGRPVPGIPILSDYRFNFEPTINEVRREDAAKKKARAREKMEAPKKRRFSGLLGSFRRSDKKKVNIDFTRKEYYGVPSPGTFLGDTLEKQGLTVASASEDSDGELAPRDIVNMIETDDDFTRENILIVSSITGISVKEWNSVISDWEEVEEDYEKLSDE